MSALHNKLSLLAIVLGIMAFGAAGSDNSPQKPAKPVAKVTQVLGAETYKQMEVAQKAFDSKDYKGAEAALDVLKAKQDKLNDYEKATLWNLYAAVFRGQENYKRAIDAYVQVLKQNNLPEGVRNDALFALAQMFLITDDYKNAIKVLDRWFAVVDEPQPDAYVVLAQAHFQLQHYEQAKNIIIKGLSVAKQRNLPPKENWLSLLRGAFYELKDYGNATKVTEVLATMHPKGSYFVQLAGLYGLQNSEPKQAEVMHAAYVGGYLTSSSDLLNVARLYMAENAPQRGADLLRARLEDKTLAENEETLQLLAQALSLAKDADESIPVFSKLAGMTGESKYYNYLGQAYMQATDWAKAADAFDSALKGKNVVGADSIRMQMGMALYNAKKLVEAREVFKGIPAASPNAQAASTWQKFITTEINQASALRARGE